MQRFSYLLINDSDSDSSETATGRAGRTANDADASPQGSAADKRTNHDTANSSQRMAMSATPTAEPLAAVPSAHAVANEGFSTSTHLLLPPSSPETNAQDDLMGYHDSSPPPPQNHSDCSSAQAKSPPNSLPREDGVDARCVLPGLAHAMAIMSADTEEAPCHAGAVPSDPDLIRKDLMPPPTAAACGSPLAAPSEGRAPTASSDTFVATVQEEQEAQSREQTGGFSQHTTRPSLSAAPSLHGDSRKHQSGSVGSNSQRGEAAAARDTVAEGGSPSVARPTTNAVPLSSSVTSLQPSATSTLLRARGAAAPQKASALCGFFSFCKPKRKPAMALHPTPLPALAAEKAIGNTEVQAPPADSAGQVSSILAPVVASSSFRHTSAPSSEKNSAVLQDNEVNRVQVAVSPLNHEFAARPSAEPPAPVATLPSNATHNGLFGGDDAQGTGDGGALTHRTSSRSTTSQGVDVAPEESGESMRVLAGLEKVQGQAPEDSSVKHVKKVVRRHSKQHADKKRNTAVSENLERPPDKSESVPQCALAEGVPLARTSVPPSSQDPLSEGKVKSSKVAPAAASIKVRETPSHAVAARPSSPASDSRGGTYTESGSSSYIHSSRPRGSRRSEVSSTASTSLSFAQRQRVSGAPLRHSAKVSTAPSRVRSAHDASLASHQNHKLTSFLLQEEEHLLRMPAYQRRVLLDLRARERRDAEEAAREWRHLTFRPHIHSSPYNIGADAMRAVVTGRKHSPSASAHESPTYSPVSGFWEPSPGRYQIHRMSPRLLEPRCTPKQPAPPTFKPVISQYAKSSVKPACSVFKRLYRPRSLSPPAVGDSFTHRPNISQLARQLYEHNPGGRLSHRYSEDDVAAPHSMSVFDRLYRMRKSPGSGRSTSPRCSAAPTQSFRSRSPEMEVSQSAMRPRQTLQDPPYRNDRPRGHESHSPFHTREEIHSDVGTEDVKVKDSNGGDLSLSQLSFNTRDAVMTSTSLHHFPKTQIEVEAA